MKTKAVRIYGKNDLRLDEFELPPIKDDEILAHVVSDSLCMSSYKAAIQGADHKRVPANIAEHPTIVGHEFSGRIVEVGKKWQDQFQPGQKFSVQPAVKYTEGPEAIGYSYEYTGGDATDVILCSDIMEDDCLLIYEGEGYFPASLAEPMACIINAYHAVYHTTPLIPDHKMGIVEGGRMAILAGVGPMGLGAMDYALHGDRRPSLLVVTDIDPDRLARAEKLFPPEKAKEDGIRLMFVNTRDIADVPAHLISLTEGKGYDDVLVMAPVKPVVECGDLILGTDGCLNFFAGPSDKAFTAEFNFYNVHYGRTHIVGTSGGSTADMREGLALMSQGRINPAVMVTHVGGLDCVVETTLNLPKIPGGKKLVYTNISMPLTAIADFAAKGETDPVLKKLAEITERHHGLWSLEAEEYLLANAQAL